MHPQDDGEEGLSWEEPGSQGEHAVPTVLNSAFNVLQDIASKVGVKLSDNTEHARETLDVITLLEVARSNLFAARKVKGNDFAVKDIRWCRGFGT